MKISMTLGELIVVLIIVGILAGVGIPMFFKAVERSRSREAEAQLKLLRAAEKIYYLDYATYAGCANTVACNNIFGLEIPEGEWQYSIDVTPPDTVDEIKAVRLKGYKKDCIYYINLTGDPTTTTCEQ